MTPEESFVIFGVNLSWTSKGQRLFICVIGIFSCFVTLGYLQEGLFAMDGWNGFGWFLTAVTCAINTGCAYIAKKYSAPSPQAKARRRAESKSSSDAGLEHDATPNPYGDTHLLVSPRQSESVTQSPLQSSLLVSLALVMGVGLSNVAVGHLAYPTVLVMKSCKLIPVMIGGMVILGRSYSLGEYLATLMMVVGTSVYSLGDTAVDAELSPIGLAAMAGALFADAIIGNLQEAVMKKHSFSQPEMIYASNLYATMWASSIAAVSGELKEALIFVTANPVLVPRLVFYGIAGYLGVVFVLACIREFGTLVATMVTSLRKTVTITLSFLLYPKPWVWQHVLGGSAVACAIAIHAYVGKGKSLDDWLARQPQLAWSVPWLQSLRSNPREVCCSPSIHRTSTSQDDAAKQV